MREGILARVSECLRKGTGVYCRNCGYALFNLTEPRCPECSSPFDVQAYSFVPGSVQFGCPYCGQLYEGNDARGLPFPREFNCVRCHRPISVSGMRVVPVTDEAFVTEVPGTGLPWEVPRGMGLVARWWETCKLGMFNPTRYYRQLRSSEDLGKSIGFAAACAVVSGALASLIGAGASAWVIDAVSRMSGAPLGAASGPAFGSPLGLVQVILAVPLAILGLFSFGASVHAGVWLLARERRGYSSTVSVLAYAMCPAVWALIPMVGGVVSGIWSLVVAIIGLSIVHRMTILRALLAYFLMAIILLFVLVLFGAVLGLMFLRF